MITKRLQLNDYTITRMPIGWAIQLLSVFKLKDTEKVCEILSKFIEPKISVDTITPDFLKRVIDFNFRKPKRKPNEDSNVESDYDEIVTGIVFQLSNAFGWTIDYILENVDFYQAFELIERIDIDKANGYIAQALITHSPEKLCTLIDPLLYASKSGSRVVNIFDYRREKLSHVQ